jgi:hypothetical protein
MRDVANASIDFTGVPHLLARPSKGEPNGVVVWLEIQPLVDRLAAKLDRAQLEIEQNRKLAATIKRFTLTGGVAEVRASDEDGENYTYTTFRIPTGFTDEQGNPTTDFEDFAMSAALAPFSNQGFRYEFHKVAPDVAVFQFQSITGTFPDDRVRVSLIRIPSAQTVPALIPGYELLNSPDNNAPWLLSQRDRVGEDRFLAATTRIGISPTGFATAYLRNGNELSFEWGFNKSFPEIDAFMGLP